MKRIKKRVVIYVSTLWNDKRGELLMQPIIIMLFITILILNSMNLYYMILKYQYVHFIAKEITRSIELDGQVTSEINQQFKDLNEKLKTDSKLTVSDVKYFNNYDKTIQFRDSFKVTVEDTYEIEILNPTFSKPVTVEVPIKSTVPGMSEVYWKD